MPVFPRRRRPIRIRLTATFALVMGLVLLVAGLVVYVQFRSGFDARIDDELEQRQAVVGELAEEGSAPARIVDRSGEALAQVYGSDGEVLASSRLLARGRLLTRAQVRRAREGTLLFTKGSVPGSDDGGRVRAFALPDGRAVAIGEARVERERALHRLALVLALTLPVALAAASLAGYRVATAALQPVEEMRARAETIDAEDTTERLPEPGTRDELDRLAATLNALLDRLGRALEHERRIVSDAGHELRTPISVLRTRLDVALGQTLDADRARAVLEEARQDAIRLSRLAGDILLLARADQGRLPLRLEPLDVADLVDAVAARFDDTATADGRTVTARVDIPGGAVVLADPDRTAQILDNLVDNALRHGRGTVEITACSVGEHVAIAVRDHGPGFDPAFAERAFERFSQTDPAKGGQSAGLGLSIARAVAEAQSGTVHASGHPDGGAVVTVTLPVA